MQCRVPRASIALGLATGICLLARPKPALSEELAIGGGPMQSRKRPTAAELAYLEAAYYGARNALKDAERAESEARWAEQQAIRKKYLEDLKAKLPDARDAFGVSLVLIFTAIVLELAF